MRFTVEVEDFWLEEEELSVALQQAVKNEVISSIRKDIKDQVSAFMDKILKEEIYDQMQTRVTILMSEFVESGKVKGRYSGDGEMTVNEWIAKEFKGSNESILKYVNESAKKQTDELKRRYDLLFASQIVSKINEQGLLKEDVARLLLPKE